MAIIKLGAGHKYKFTSSGSNLQFKEGTDNPLGLTIASGGLQSHGNLEIISGSAIFDGPISASNAIRFTGLGGTYPSAGNVKTVYVQADGTMQLGVIGSGTVDSSSGNIFTSDGNLVASRQLGLVNSNLSVMPGAIGAGTATLFVGGDATYENKVGINTSAPTDALHVVGAISASTDIYAGGDIFCEGIVTADEFHTTIVSTSIAFSSGNTEFGDETSDLHKFTGSLEVSGNLTVTDDDSLFQGMVSMSALSSSLGIATQGGIHGTSTLRVDGDADFNGDLDVDGNVQLDGTLTVGVNDTGYDVKFFGDTAGKSFLWDASTDELILAANSKLSFHDASGGENILATADGHLEINAGTLLTITAPTVDINASIEVQIDGDVDLNGALDVSGDINGDDLLIAGSASFGTSITASGDISSSGNFDLTGNAQIDGTLTIGADDHGKDVKFYGASPNSYMQWDASEDGLVIKHSPDEVGLGVYTTSSAIPSTPQFKVGRDTNQYIGIQTSDRDAWIVHRQDEDDPDNALGQVRTRFQIWDRNSSSGSHEWSFESADASGENVASARMVISSSGQVGIGTTSPSRTLDVNSGTGNVVAKFESTDGTAKIEFADNSTSGEVSIGAIGNDFHILANGGERVRVLAGGNVGIGTDTPGSGLHVTNASELPFQVESSDAIVGIKFTDDSDNNAIYYAGSSNHFYTEAEFGIGTTTSTGLAQLEVSASYSNIAISASGKVVITSPNHSDSSPALMIEGNSLGASPGAGALIEIKTNTDYRARGLHLTSHEDANGWFAGVPYTGDGFSIGFDDADNGIPWYDASSSLFIKEDGKVGIGTSSPSAILDIEDSSGVTIDINSSTGDGKFRFQDNGATKWSVGRDNTTNNLEFASGSALGSADNVLTLTPTGNVGIGTTDPQAKLHVEGKISASNDIYITSTDPTIHFHDTDGATYLGYVGASNAVFEVRANASGQDLEIRSHNFDNAIYIDDSTSRIGIGLDNPESTLSILGDISASGTIYAARFESSGSSTKIEVIDDMQITGSISANGSGSFSNVTASLDGMHVSGTLSIINQDGPTAYIKTKVGTYDEYHFRNDQDAFQIYNATDDRKELVADGDGGIGIGVATPSTNGFALQVSGAIGPFGDNEHALGTRLVRFSDVFAVQTTVGAIFETGLTTEGVGKLKTGTVVVWKDGKLIPSYKERDKMVMGITQEGKDEPIILGAEPILVTGEVNEGDFLITSDKQGHAKAQPDEYLLRTGTVIAQALESSKGESNLIKGMIRKL